MRKDGYVVLCTHYYINVLLTEGWPLYSSHYFNRNIHQVNYYTVIDPTTRAYSMSLLSTTVAIWHFTTTDWWLLQC